MAEKFGSVHLDNRVNIKEVNFRIFVVDQGSICINEVLMDLFDYIGLSNHQNSCEN